MNASGGQGGGATLSPPPVPPGKLLRAVAFTPAVRGYPGGIADMTAEQDGTAARGPGDGVGSWAGEQGATALAGGGGRNPAKGAPGGSVWQRSLAAWQDAGIDWLREPRPAPSAEDRAAAEADLQHTQPIPVVPGFAPPGQPGAGERAVVPAGEPATGADGPVAAATMADDAVADGPGADGAAADGAGADGAAADGAGADGAAADLAGGDGAVAARAGAGGDVIDEDMIVLGAAGVAAPGSVAADPGSVAADPGSVAPGDAAEGSGSAATETGAGGAVGGDVIVPGEASAAAAAASAAVPVSAAAAADSVAATSSVAPASAAATAATADGPKAAAGEPSAATDGTQAAAGEPSAAADGTQAGRGAAARKPGRARPGKRVVIVAAATSVVLLAGAITGIAVARSGPSGPTFGLVTPYPAAALADGTFPAQTAGAAVAPSLTGLAAAGKTVVAVGSQGAGPLSLPLILVSQNGGRAWARAALGGGSATVGPGAVPALTVRGRDSWLALGQHSAWTSADGQVWQAGPGVPMSAGDKILALARTRSGFIAVGENIPGPVGGGVPSPVLWTSADGRTWQRKGGAALTLGDRGKLGAGGGTMVSLRWAAYRAGTVVVGGEISQPVVKHRGRRKVIVNVDSPGLWRSRDDGVTWQPVKLPVGHGATIGLAGIAATGSAFVAVRPGRTRTGRRDAIAFVSGTGSTWRYAGRLISGRRAPLHPLTVAASGQTFVVSGTTGASRVAFVSIRGRYWHKTADQGLTASTAVTGVTVAPGSVVVTAGFRHRPGSGAAGRSPYLLLTRAGRKARRTPVGQAALAAAGTADVTVNSLAAAGGEQVAAGSADSAPALWSAATGGHWVPSTASMPASWRPGSLTSVVHGSAGWLAVGNAGPSAAPVPLAQPGLPPTAGPSAPSAGVVMTSADGRTWQPGATAQSLTAPGTTLAQAAAGPAGYVVVGSAATPGAATPGGEAGPAAWYSAGLGTWTRATITAAGPGAGDRMLAVTAGRPGFVAAGSSGSAPAVWTSQTGSAWRLTRLPVPAGAASAVLTQVTAAGGRVVAAGDALRAAAAGQRAVGGVPFAAVSGDGGRTWREVVLHATAGPSTITALTAAGRGFVAAGLSGVAGDQAMLAWWSPDGLSWQGGELVAGPLHGRGVQQITALSAADGALAGAGYAVTGSGEHPLSWRARYR